MKCIIGLGNPGKEYRSSRHNIGFRIIDFLAEKQRVSLTAGHGEFVAGKHRSGKYVLIKPLTYMNNSGYAMIQVQQQLKPKLRDCLVIYDDLDLPLGVLRFRPRGSAGTHRGMQSVVEKLGTNAIPRLRIGIGSTLKTGPAEEFVLAPFSPVEKPLVDEVIEFAADGVMTFVHEGIQTAMNTYNKHDLAT